MQLDTGTSVILIAALIFYLRLIVIQRQRAKRYRRTPPPAPSTRKGKKGRARTPAEPEPSFYEKYTIFSTRRSDWIIAGSGLLAIVLGVLLYAGVFGQGAAHEYWWVPTALGIIAFSWGFR